MKTKTRSIAFAITVLAAVACVLAGCGSSPPGSSGQSITLYNGQHEQTTDSLVEGFEKQTGIKVNVRDDDEDTLADEIVTEGSRSPADVIYTENSPALEYLAEQGAARPGRPARRSRRRPSKYNSPQGDWVGVSARVSVLIYNPQPDQRQRTADARCWQLADPEVQGQARVRCRRDRLPADRDLGTRAPTGKPRR